MELFTIPEQYRVIKIKESTADELLPLEQRTKVYELLNTETGDTYYFKHGEKATHELHKVDDNAFIGQNIAKELLAMNYAKMIGVNVCEFWFAYLPLIDAYGILTKKHSTGPVPLEKLVCTLEKKVGPRGSEVFNYAILDAFEEIPSENFFAIYKASVCDILTLNKDRHPNNILFRDSDMKEFYPYFDCDYAFNCDKNMNMRDKHLSLILRYGLKDMQLLNFIYCFSRVTEPEIRQAHSNSDYLLQVPSEADLKEIIEFLNLVDIVSNLDYYLHYITVEMNKYISFLLNKKQEDAIMNLIRYMS